MNLFNDMKDMGLPVKSRNDKVHCKVFEDNLGAVETSRTLKLFPITKNLNFRMHHFRSYINDTKEISIHKIDTINKIGTLLD